MTVWSYDNMITDNVIIDVYDICKYDLPLLYEYQWHGWQGMCQANGWNPKLKKAFRDMKYRAPLFIHTDTDIHIDTLNDINIDIDL